MVNKEIYKNAIEKRYNNLIDYYYGPTPDYYDKGVVINKNHWKTYIKKIIVMMEGEISSAHISIFVGSDGILYSGGIIYGSGWNENEDNDFVYFTILSWEYDEAQEEREDDDNDRWNNL